MQILRIAALALMAAILSFGAARAADGLVTKPSAHPATVTIDRLQAELKKRGLVVFTLIDHQAAAKAAGLTMPAATVVVFGNPKAGTPAFLKKPTLAIDLPLKALVWEDANGKVFITYNSADYVFGDVFSRHGLPNNPKMQDATAKMLDTVATAAAAQ
jgi:uncharacterized protein (DUF302 family)